MSTCFNNENRNQRKHVITIISFLMLVGGVIGFITSTASGQATNQVQPAAPVIIAIPAPPQSMVDQTQPNAPLQMVISTPVQPQPMVSQPQPAAQQNVHAAMPEISEPQLQRIPALFTHIIDDENIMVFGVITENDQLYKEVPLLNDFENGDIFFVDKEKQTPLIPEQLDTNDYLGYHYLQRFKKDDVQFYDLKRNEVASDDAIEKLKTSSPLSLSLVLFGRGVIPSEIDTLNPDLLVMDTKNYYSGINISSPDVAIGNQFFDAAYMPPGWLNLTITDGKLPDVIEHVYTVKKPVWETHVHKYTVCKMVPETKVKENIYQVEKGDGVFETRVKQVSYTVPVPVYETREKTYKVVKLVPETRVIETPSAGIKFDRDISGIKNMSGFFPIANLDDHSSSAYHSIFRFDTPIITELPASLRQANTSTPAQTRPTAPPPTPERPQPTPAQSQPTVRQPAVPQRANTPTLAPPQPMVSQPQPAAPQQVVISTPAQPRPAVKPTQPAVPQRVNAPKSALPPKTVNQARFLTTEQAAIDRFISVFGDDLNAADGTGKTLLHQAAAYWDVAVTQYLVAHGAALHAIDATGATPLHAAARSNKNVAVVEFLVSKKADVTLKDRIGNTPLHAAASNKNAEFAKFLVAQGADVTAKNKAGKTPLDIAKEMKNTAVVEYFSNLRLF